MKRFFLVILNPFFLPLWVTLVILLIFPLGIGKFTAIQIEKGEYVNNQSIWYDDLNYDGNTEQITVLHNSLGTAGLTVSNTTGVLEQWTFRGRYDFDKRPGIVITGDGDGNGMKEIYVFTLSGDSVLMHCICDFQKAILSFSNKFITRVGKRNEKMDPLIITAEMDDLTGDANKELIFGVSTGYSLHPRRIYAYDAIRDTFLLSPESGYFINRIIQQDITGDGLNEIIPVGYAASNVHDSATPYPDWNSWLMVLDRDLQFVFKPVSFPDQFSTLLPVVIRYDSGKVMLAALYLLSAGREDSATLMAFDNMGRIEKTVQVPKSASLVLPYADKMGKDQILLFRSKEGFDIFDASFTKKKTVSAAYISSPELFDVDLDGQNEVIIPGTLERKFVVFRNNLKHPVEMDIDGTGEQGILYSLKKQAGKPVQLYIQFGSSYSLYQYGKNPAYYKRFLIYAAIYLSLLLFTLLVRKIQQEQLRKRAITEKKIANLQLQIVRNQLDPHFIMNAVNSIIASITDKGKEEAREQLYHFARLHRSMLLSSDRIQRSLQEEIEFTENYLALEKFRFCDTFEYHIEIDPFVDKNAQIPKMILQIHAENALNHGIRPLKGGGLLNIKVFRDQKNLVLEITDNGVGRAKSLSNRGDSTGKGLAIMDQYAELFNKYHNVRIKTEIFDLYDPGGDPSGTCVKVILSGIYEDRKD